MHFLKHELQHWVMENLGELLAWQSLNIWRSSRKVHRYKSKPGQNVLFHSILSQSSFTRFSRLYNDRSRIWRWITLVVPPLSFLFLLLLYYDLELAKRWCFKSHGIIHLFLRLITSFFSFYFLLPFSVRYEVNSLQVWRLKVCIKKVSVFFSFLNVEIIQTSRIYISWIKC